MKRLFVLYIFLMIGTASFAQKKGGQDQEGSKDDKQPQDTRYKEGASGVKRSISYKFSNLVKDSDPGNGNFRYNREDTSGITYIFLDDIDLSGEDQTKWYSTWDDTTGATGRGRINIVEYEGKNVNVFDVKGVFVEEDGYWKIPVEFVSGSLPADGVTYYYVFERIENKDKIAKEEPQPVPVIEEKQEEAAVIAAAVTVAAVVEEPKEVPQPVQVVEEKKEESAPAPQPEPVTEVKTEPVVQPEPVAEVKTEPVVQPEPVAEVKTEPVVQLEPVAEVKEEPVSQPEPVKQETKVEEAAVIAAAVTVAAVAAEPKEEPQPVQVAEEKKEEAAPAPQPEPVAEVKTEQVVQPAPVVKEEPLVQPEPVKQDSKVEETAATVAVVTVVDRVPEPKPEPKVRTTQQSQPASKPEATQPPQPKQQSQPAPSNQPKTTTQSSQQQPAPVKKETPASQPAPKATQPESRPAQPSQPAPTTRYPASTAGTYGDVFTKKSDGSRIWHGIIETGYGLKAGDYGINNYRINFISSFNLGQHFMIGLGLGYRRYFDKPERHTEWYMVSGKNQVPVFLDLRYLFTKKQLTPYLALGIGGSTEKSKSDTTSYGSFINPSAGIWFRMSKNTALFAGVAYEGLEMEFAKPVDNIPFRRKNNSVSLNIGIQF